MITIIVDNKREYDMMQEVAENYVCRQLSLKECCVYPPGNCASCYKHHHIKCGIRLIEPVDNPDPEQL